MRLLIGGEGGFRRFGRRTTRFAGLREEERRKRGRKGVLTTLIPLATVVAVVAVDTYIGEGKGVQYLS